MTTTKTYPPIMLVTGPRKSGRTTYAVLLGRSLFIQGLPFYHNGTALIGWLWEDYLNDPDGLLTLAREIPATAPILIEEADTHAATRRSDDPAHDATIASALEELAAKSCFLILTTVQGNERRIAKSLVENAYDHVTPYMNAESKELLSLATIHRLGNRLIPASTMMHDTKLVYTAMALANTFKETRKGAPGGHNVQLTRDHLFSVTQPSIDQMKYPRHAQNPVHYRYRIIRNLGNRMVHRLTKDSLLDFTWLESVNEHPHETVALEVIGRTIPQWGFEYEPIATPQDDRFPDGEALINGEQTNLEVVSIQPRFPGGHSLHDLVAISQVDRAPRPQHEAILHCLNCKGKKSVPSATLENLPNHNERHRWVLYLPASAVAPDFPSDLTVTPPLTISQEGFAAELEKRIWEKSLKIAEQGARKKNWIIVLSQGFPVEPQWYSGLSAQWPTNIDGIVVVATDMYLGAFHDGLPFHDLTVIQLKCPIDDDGHNCYHPSYLYRVSHLNRDLEFISPDIQTPEELSYAAFSHPWPPNPIKRTLVARDENENELGRLEDVIITRQQIKEVLDERCYEWHSQSPTHMTLHRQRDATAGCWAEMQASPRPGTEAWSATAHHGATQAREVFSTHDEAKRWCEGIIATTLLDSEDMEETG